MAVFADDPRPDTREQLGDHAAVGVLVGKLEYRRALPRHGVFPDLADLYRCAVWRGVRVRMRHEFSFTMVSFAASPKRGA